MVISNVKKQHGNDIYFMETINGRVLINNNYVGVLILNNELQLLKKISICKGLIIERAVKKNNEILLICSENEKIIYINCQNYKYKIIQTKKFGNINFSDFFEWHENQVILLDYKGNLFSLDLIKFQLQIIHNDKMNFSIQKTLAIINKFSIQKVFLSEEKVIVQKSSTVLELLDYANDMKSIVEFPKAHYYDFEMCDNFLAAISEKQVFIYSITSMKYTLCSSEDGYRFLRGKFVLDKNNIFFIIISGNKKNIYETIIKKYVVL